MQGIDSYKINTIHTNAFEQSNLAASANRGPTANFFMPRKVEHSSRRTASPLKSTVEVLATVLEGHSLVEHTEYKEKLLALLTKEILQSVTSKHRVLRGAVLEALDAREFRAPSKDVATVFANMIGLNILVVDPVRKSYFLATQSQTQEPRTVVMGHASLEMYPSADRARASLEKETVVEELPFKAMKIAELRAYASRALPPRTLPEGAKREEILRKLKERFP